MTTKISCGGFDIDNDTLIEEDGVLKVKNGGGGNGVLVVHRSRIGTPPRLTLDKTWQEIFDSASTGAAFIADVAEEEVETKLVTTVYVNSGVYYCEDNSELVYSTDSADGYPAATRD